jgi:hypothetical protein
VGKSHPRQLWFIEFEKQITNQTPGYSLQGMRSTKLLQCKPKKTGNPITNYQIFEHSLLGNLNFGPVFQISLESVKYKEII